MIILADYEFYQNTYKGQLSSDLFNGLIPKASFIISKNVNRKLNEEDSKNEEIEMVACELVDLLNADDFKNGNSAKVQSISIDGVSKSYSQITEDELKNRKIAVLNELPLELISFL